MNFYAFLDELEKIAATRSVKEWRALNAAGDTAGADAIAAGHAQLGAKPRYLEDISLGGAEAGVDKMMGSAAAPAAAGPNLQQRFQQYQQNKAELGVAGRSPTPSVKASPEGRAALLRGTQGPAQAAAPNESGYIARKLYKPDSDISRGEFTPQLLAQKQQITDQARALSPEAKAMVPAMYGHQTMGAGPLQRSTSMHEFVPGLSDMRGKNIGTADKPVFSQMEGARAKLTDVQNKVLNPMAEKGMTMADTISRSGVNYGNVVNSPSGPKVLDFLPNVKGQKNPATESFRTYAPQGSQFVEGGAKGNMGALRKEVFNPQMRINPATGPDQMRAAAILRGEKPPMAAVPSPQAAVGTARPGAAPAAAATSIPASRQPPSATPTVAPRSRLPAAAPGHISTAPAAPAAMRASAHVPSAPLLKATGTMGRLETAAAKTAPGFLRSAGKALSHI